LQHLERAQADVGQVANRGGHHIQATLGIMLATGCGVRSAQGQLE
jgi:predicted RNA-binding protein YlqC (UPF0109 family)